MAWCCLGETGRLHSFSSLSTNAAASSSLVTSLNYAPDGGRLVVLLNFRDVVVIEQDGTFRTLLHQAFGAKYGVQDEISQAFVTPDGKGLVLVAEVLQLSKGSFDMVNEKTISAEVQFWDVATGTQTRRLKATGSAYFQQAWVSADGRELMDVMQTYAHLPKTGAERQALHHASPPAAPVILISKLNE